MKGYAVLDLETTGLSATADRIVEIGVLMLDRTGVEQRFAGTLVNPSRAIPGRAAAVHGITDQMVATAPGFSRLAESLSNALEGRVLVGHNITTFDNKFLVEEFRRCGMEWQPGVVLDTLKLARTLLPGAPSRKLSALCELVGIVNAQHHRAEGDVRATWELLAALKHSDEDDVLELRAHALPTASRSFPRHLMARHPD
jgi:DNA polymerase III epsilon subunit family exonuclease